MFRSRQKRHTTRNIQGRRRIQDHVTSVCLLAPRPARHDLPHGGGSVGVTSLSDLDEAQLLDRARAGDGRAFQALVTPYRTMVATACYRITGDHGESEDAVQQALLAAWRNLDRFAGRSAFSTWLYRIAHNSALSVVRKRRPEPTDQTDDLAAATAPDPASRAADGDTVRWALAKLPPDFRAAVVLRDCCAMTYQEIADTQGVKIDTVKSRIARGRQALRSLLEDADG